MSQPCRFELIPNRDETIVLDVCHNVDGFKAVIGQIEQKYPEVERIKIVFGVSKSKKLDTLVHMLEDYPKISDIYLVSRPHMRLYKVEDAHKVVKDFGSSKLRDLISESENITTKSDTSDASTYEQGNNIAVTLDYLLNEN
jgi:folylpolyglutamate synthase/dihydropteroate synthase